ncbi:MAG: hypothetical protein C4547_01845 [Phycisphaerales bacterium]|nr:MAG: hypothetical protein C4547_01845 [Phycisphaerales bacterium]
MNTLAWMAILIFSPSTPAGIEASALGAPQQEVAPVQEKDEDDDLADRLLRKTTGDADDDVMDRILRLMAEAQRRLDLGFDPGEETQAVQAKILEELDDAIQAAASRQRRRSSEMPPAQSDTRRRQDPSKPQQQPPGRQDGRDATRQVGEPDQAAPEGAGVVEGAALDGSLIDRRRGWGHLPQRDRDEILQSFGERMLERYQAWIERYYRALQSDDDGLDQP